jgi:hypothetical protein
MFCTWKEPRTAKREAMWSIKASASITCRNRHAVRPKARTMAAPVTSSTGTKRRCRSRTQRNKANNTAAAPAKTPSQLVYTVKNKVKPNRSRSREMIRWGERNMRTATARCTNQGTCTKRSLMYTLPWNHNVAGKDP